MDFVEVMNTYDSNPDGTAKSPTAPADVGGSPETSSSPFRIDRPERRMSGAWLDEMTSPKGSSEKPSDLGEDAPELVILYLHGGGYWAFTGKSHLEYVARLVKKIRSTHLRAKAICHRLKG
jgi:acetyl esterase/lipase